MANVVRVIKNSNYTTLSNYHFKDKRLSWKAKGLLSTMLSLPDNWNYTIEGLATLAGDGIKSTNSGLAELEKNGYLSRKQLRDENGHFAMTEYTIFEEPVVEAAKEPEIPHKEEDIRQLKEEKDVPLCQNGQTAENTAFQPLCQKRKTEKRFAEKGVLLNTNILNTDILKSSSANTIKQQGETPKAELTEEQAKEKCQEKERLRGRLKVEQMKTKYPILAELLFSEIASRSPEICAAVTPELFCTLCVSIHTRQKQTPIRMLSNFIAKCVDNAISGIIVRTSETMDVHKNSFMDFEQREYDFNKLDEELLAANALAIENGRIDDS